jgi:uncharacterized protein (TIGR02118 family)
MANAPSHIMHRRFENESSTYPNNAGATFDFDYYMKKHIPMVCDLLGTSVEVVKGMSATPGEAPAFVCTGRIKIDGSDQFALAMAKHGPRILADVPNYTNITPVIQIDEVLTPS